MAASEALLAIGTSNNHLAQKESQQSKIGSESMTQKKVTLRMQTFKMNLEKPGRKNSAPNLSQSAY
jgi:hypothetical protein